LYIKYYPILPSADGEEQLFLTCWQLLFLSAACLAQGPPKCLGIKHRLKIVSLYWEPGTPKPTESRVARLISGNPISESLEVSINRANPMLTPKLQDPCPPFGDRAQNDGQ
jgi:hypothetical protein